MPHQRQRRRRTQAAGAKRRGREAQKYSVFLSHSSRDAWLSRLIKEKIEAAIPKASVWLDEMTLMGGQELTAALAEGIDKADELIVLVGNESLRSQWVSWEIGLAVGFKKRITPLLNNVDHDAMAPLKGIKSYELNLFDRFMLELKSRVRKRQRI